jgi:Domain of unknown function (DUF4070)
MESTATSNFDPPNFRTLLPLPVLLRGLRNALISLYSPSAFYDRAHRSLVQWDTKEQQKVTPCPWSVTLGILGRSMLRQGLLSSYRKAYWKFMLQVFTNWFRNPPKLSMGITLLLSGHHFISYANSVVEQLESELRSLGVDEAADGKEPSGTRQTLPSTAA